MPLKYRVLTIVALCLASIWALFPRNVTTREIGSDRLMHDVTVRHIPLRQGLDLKGGTYLALEVDDSKQAIPADKKADAIDRALKTVRSRIEGFGVSESVVQKQGADRIIVQIPGIQDPERARKLVEAQAFLQFKIADKTQALERALPRLDQVIKQRGLTPASDTTAKVAATATNGLQGLLNADTSKKTDSTKKGAVGAKKDSTAADSLKLQPGGAFSTLIEQGGMPGEFYIEASKIPTIERYLADSAVKAAMPPGKDFLPGSDSASLQGKWYKTYYIVDNKPISTGEHLVDARPNQNTVDGTVVEFSMDNIGGRRFRSETGKHIGDYMAIILDDRVMGRPPVIQGAIGTRGQITMGGKSLADAQDLALVLRAGALPVQLRVADTHTIGPSLGEDSVRKGLRA
ncbi:MAG TPA: hypothetical protein VKP00_08285, partial [Gemmatimonadaceae bacterium]|nr:hypothetical protein [Gemmatimonadaceae bacterium]